MSFAEYSFFALPLWGAMFALYFILRRAGLARQSLVAKCAGTFLAVAGAVLRVRDLGGNPLTSPWVWFFLLCMVADALLEIWFIPGMLLFGAAHLVLGISTLLSHLESGRLPWWTLLLWAGAVLAALLLFRRELPDLGKLAPAFVLYALLLGGMLALGLVTPLVTGSPASAAFSVGMACFYVSDMMVAKTEIGHVPQQRLQKPIMVLYWLALYLICAQLWI